MSATTLQAKATKILIVEDEPDMCLLLNILLADKKMELDHVRSISDAADYLEKEQPNVVLLDNRLPDGYGVDFISFIKSRYPAVRVIMISGFDPSAQDVALYNGADTFLQKPFTKAELYESVVKALN